MASRRETLNLTQLIVDDIKPLYEAGGISRNQYLRQANQVQEIRAQVASIAQERTRVIGNVAAQLNQIDRQMIRIRAELVGLNETISYRTVRAPIDGKSSIYEFPHRLLLVEVSLYLNLFLLIVCKPTSKCLMVILVL